MYIVLNDCYLSILIKHDLLHDYKAKIKQKNKTTKTTKTKAKTKKQKKANAKI